MSKLLTGTVYLKSHFKGVTCNACLMLCRVIVDRDVFRQDKDYAVAAVGPAGLRCGGSLHRRHGATRAPGSRQRQEAGGGGEGGPSGLLYIFIILQG